MYKSSFYNPTTVYSIRIEFVAEISDFYDNRKYTFDFNDQCM